MELGQYVESYRFWDVVVLWGRETLQHEHIVARVLAKGVLRDGLRVQSVDPRWTLPGTFELLGSPYVGYVAKADAVPVIVRSSALQHLQSIVGKAAVPDAQELYDEFITKQDFRTWLEQTAVQLPAFWFTPLERAQAATARP